MKIEKNDMVMVYDGGGTVPHCKYTGRFGDLTAYWQEIVSSQSKMKAVVCVETGKIYESIMSAGRDVERTDGAICQALRNESRTCAGYHWKYLDE